MNELIAQQLEEFKSDPKAAQQIAGAKNADSARLAAWTAVARVLLNLDETITRE